jgi:hypothetical protein
MAWQALLLAIAAGSAPVISPPVPFEDVGACPFEGCVYREWTASDAVALRNDRSPSAPIAFRLKPGDKVTAVTGVVVTVKAARVKFRVPFSVSTSDGPLRIEAGQSLYLLTDLGEGFSKAWFDGRLYPEIETMEFLNSLCIPDTCAGELVEESQTVWWVQIKTPSGEIGWTNEPYRFDGIHYQD